MTQMFSHSSSTQIHILCISPPSPPLSTYTHAQTMDAFLDKCGVAKGQGKASRTEPFYWNRQYVFAGATVPDTGTKGVVARLIDKYPDLVFVQGDQLHRSKAGIDYKFHEASCCLGCILSLSLFFSR